jgi:hypothetical protein
MRWIPVGICVAFLGGAIGPSVGLAQLPDDRPTYRGLFGDRRLGQPVQPGPSRFGGGIQRGPSGDFLGQGRTDGSNMFITPWRRVEPGPLPFNWGVSPPVISVTVPPPVIVLPQPQEALPVEPQQQPTPGQSPADIWFRSPLSPTGMIPPVAPGIAGSMYGPRIMPCSDTAQASGESSAYAAGRFQPSPALSARITKLAQAGDVQTSAGLQVCVQGSTAIVRGAVATPYQRSLVGNLVSMEPGVWQVDNQVVVTTPGSAVAASSR